MRTPKEYTDNLKKSIITSDMLADCLFSVNKRAKNCRDKERGYRCGYDRYNNEERYREQKESYYSMKDKMLELINPICIHKEKYYERERIYDYEDCYWECKEKGLFVHENGYYDREMHEYVEFGDINVENFHYYLFYELGNKSFHTPIYEGTLSGFQNLEIKEISTIYSDGRAITELISTNFIKKVMGLIDSGNYTYKSN